MSKRTAFAFAALCIGATPAAAQTAPTVSPAVLPPTAAEDLPLIDPAYGKCVNDAIARADDHKTAVATIAQTVQQTCHAAFAAAVQAHTGGLTDAQAKDFRDEAAVAELPSITETIQDRRAEPK